MVDMSIIKMKVNQVEIANKNIKSEAKSVVKSNKTSEKRIQSSRSSEDEDLHAR